LRMSRGLRQTYRLGEAQLAAAVRLDAGRLVGTLTEGDDALALDAAVTRESPTRVRLEFEGRLIRASVVRSGEIIWVAIEGRTYEVRVEEPGQRAGAQRGAEDFAASPMTGTLAKVAVSSGAQVAAGAELFVVEAMKMEYVVKAPRALTVAEVRGAAGDAVEQGAVLVTFAPETDDA
ncbi:MAG: hypothetical protein O2894_12625, partial [Planctomycetota bacterium]|nr:hypothetical protein [Planctomycetota bacterium]